MLHAILIRKLLIFRCKNVYILSDRHNAISIHYVFVWKMLMHESRNAEYDEIQHFCLKPNKIRNQIK